MKVTYPYDTAMLHNRWFAVCAFLVATMGVPIAGVSVIASTDGCAQVPVITAGIVQLVDCVGAELLKGDDTFEAIAIACAPAAIEDVITIVTAKAAEDGGPLAAAASRVHHATGPLGSSRK
jgi:hypothetical protein